LGECCEAKPSERILTLLSVAKEMMNFFTMQGLTEDEARERFWLIDTKVS
jgi:hypothetical protein